MFYSHALTIPANTTKGSPTEYDLKVTAGLLHRVEVEFPTYCAGLAHLVIIRWGSQLFPTNPQGDFASDGRAIAFDDYYMLEAAPYLLRLRGWNDDDTFSHTVTVRVGILPMAALAGQQEQLGLIRKLTRLVGIR